MDFSCSFQQEVHAQCENKGEIHLHNPQQCPADADKHKEHNNLAKQLC